MCRTGKIDPELYQVEAPQNLWDLLNSIEDDLVPIEEQEIIEYACQDVKDV